MGSGRLQLLVWESRAEPFGLFRPIRKESLWPSEQRRRGKTPPKSHKVAIAWTPYRSHGKFGSLSLFLRILPFFPCKCRENREYPKLLQTDFFPEGNKLQLQIQNGAARRIHFNYRSRSVGMSAENLSLQIQILS